MAFPPRRSIGFGAGPSRRIVARYPTAKLWPGSASNCSPSSSNTSVDRRRSRRNSPPVRGRERLVARARAWIDANLGEPIGIDAIAAAAGASRRTLSRAFFDVLEESPQAYVTRLRLHRIRSDLVAHAVSAPKIAEASNRWGICELGRMAGRYKDMFGELPSETVRLGKQRDVVTTSPHPDASLLPDRRCGASH